MDHFLIVAFDRIVLAKVRLINTPVGAGKVAYLLQADGVVCHAYDVRMALCRLGHAGSVGSRTEFGDMVPRWTATEKFSN
jgi:hypothetical protein